jgi:hypothetical protein
MKTMLRENRPHRRPRSATSDAEHEAVVSDFVPCCLAKAASSGCGDLLRHRAQGARQWAICLLLGNFAHSLGVPSKQFQHILQ